MVDINKNTIRIGDYVEVYPHLKEYSTVCVITGFPRAAYVSVKPVFATKGVSGNVVFRGRKVRKMTQDEVMLRQLELAI